MSTPHRRSTRGRGGDDTTPVPDFSAPDDGEKPPFGPRRSLSPSTSPLRNKRKSPTRYDMPALVASGSGAYGGAGMLRISESLQNQNNNFIEAFTNSRQGTVARASPERSVRGGRKSRETSAAPSDNGEGTSSPVKRGRGRPKKVTMPAIDEDEVNNDVEEEEGQDEDADLVALSRRRQLSPAKRNASPSKRGVRAASVEGTTVMENSSNYLPAESVAQNVRRKEPTPQPQPPPRTRSVPVRRYVDGPTRWQILKTRLRSRYRTYGPLARQSYQTYVEPYLRQMLVVALALLLGAGAWKYMPTMSSTTTELANFSDYTPSTSTFTTVKDWSSDMASSVSDTVSSWTSWPSSWNASSWWSSDDDSTDYSRYDGKLSKLDKRVGKIEQDMKSIMASNSLHDDSIQDLKKRLPDFVMLEKDKNGNYKIPESFIEGLRDKLDHELKQRDDSLSWDVWMKTNHKNVREKFRKSAYEVFEEEKHKIVTSDEFVAMLDARYASIPPKQLQDIEATIDAKFLDLRNLSETTAISIARHEAKKSLERLPEHQMRKLIASHMVQNQETYDMHVNFFSAAMGAMVNPHLSSKTIPKHDIGWSNGGYKLKIFNFMQPWYPEYRVPLPQSAALEPWFEAGDCWCAAPPLHPNDYNDPDSVANGSLNIRTPRLQLAVIMPRDMYPTHLIVEHVPRTATLNIHSAPRKMEVWVPIADPVKRAKVKAELDYIFNNVVQSETRPFATKYDEHIALDETYVRISRMEYRPTADNHIQTFQLHIQLKKFDVSVNKAVVRAVTNWGANHTCIYRLRMWGQEKNPQNEIPKDYNPFLEYN